MYSPQLKKNHNNITNLKVWVFLYVSSLNAQMAGPISIKFCMEVGDTLVLLANLKEYNVFADIANT